MLRVRSSSGYSPNHRTRSATASAWASVLSRGLSGPQPTMSSRRSGPARARGQHVHPLVRHQPPDEERAGRRAEAAAARPPTVLIDPERNDVRLGLESRELGGEREWPGPHYDRPARRSTSRANGRYLGRFESACWVTMTGVRPALRRQAIRRADADVHMDDVRPLPRRRDVPGRDLLGPERAERERPGDRRPLRPALVPSCPNPSHRDDLT